MTPDLLREAGEALFGASWQSDLARELGISDRTVRRWITGGSPIPDGARDDIYRLCANRGAQLQTVAGRLTANRQI